MYAHLNTSEKLTVKRVDTTFGGKSYRFLYEIVNKQTGAVLHMRYCNRRFIAANIAGDLFASIDRVEANKTEVFAAWDKETPKTFYCYLEDASAFNEPKPALAWHGYNF